MSVAGKSGITFFNPRLREGGDDAVIMVCIAPTVFNPRLREGGDDTKACDTLSFSAFQSTPPRRRRL